MAQVAHHNLESQLGALAVAPPAGLDSLPPPVPALYHLEKTSSVEPRRHDPETQLGSAAVAPPAGSETLPPPVPELHHLAKQDEARLVEASLHSSDSQLGTSAIAPPAGLSALPASVPEHHHLNGDSHTSSPQLGHNATSPHADLVARRDDLEYSDLPPFPTDVPTVPLLRISLSKLLSGDKKEIDDLWKASKEIGFFYLDLRDSSRTFDEPKDGEINGTGLLKDASALFKLGEQVFVLPVEEKQKYDFKDQGSYFGYKGLGAGVVDAEGTRDRNEFYNVSKDDILGVSEPLPAPGVLSKPESRELLRSFIQRSHAIVSLILGLLNTKLGLPEGKLESLHRLRAVSGDQVRWVSAPPQPQDDRKKALGEHTGKPSLSPPPHFPSLSSLPALTRTSDFGTLTLLHNRLGGLQVLPPKSETWSYVKPLKNHCIVNLGDALVKFTAGVLRSNIHRVVNPPGEQAESKRMSLVYFARPEDEVILKTLEGSSVVDEKRRENGDQEEEEEITAKDWITRRALGRRTGGNWKASEGTEGDRFKH